MNDYEIKLDLPMVAGVKILDLPRGHGKTTTLIDVSLETGLPILVSSLYEEKHIMSHILTGFEKKQIIEKRYFRKDDYVPTPILFDPESTKGINRDILLDEYPLFLTRYEDDINSKIKDPFECYKKYGVHLSEKYSNVVLLVDYLTNYGLNPVMATCTLCNK